MKVPLDLLPNPFEVPVWWGMESPITREEVQRALDGEDFHKDPIEPNFMDPAPRELHVRRVACLVQQGWTDAIVIEPWMGNWPIQDGNHRLAAAVFRGDPSIEVSFCGFLEDIRMAYGDDIAEQAEREWDEPIG
jgi:hypothetical protein